MKYLQDYINWAREQMARINPPKEQPIEQVEIKVEELKVIKPRKPRVKKVVE